MPHLRGEFVREFVDLTASVVDTVAPDLDPSRRRALASRLSEAFCRMWAGSYIYIPYCVSLPKADKDTKARRDAAIIAEHDHTELSVHRLSRRYGLSEIAIYRILAKARLAESTPPERPCSRA